MSSKTRDINTHYRDKCSFKNCSIGNLFRKLAFFPNNSNLKNNPPTNLTSFDNVHESNLNNNPPTKSTSTINGYENNCTRCGQKNDWERYSNVDVALKSLKNIKEEDITSDLFKELKSHLKSNDQIVGRFNVLRTYGITFDPELKVYMMVMTLADYGDLSAYLHQNFSTLTYIKKLELLYDIATGLTQIHKSGLVHRDLHSGNILCQGIKDNNLGRGEEYRFVIAFGEVRLNTSLALKICSGNRPDIPFNTPKLYSDLMQRCWSNNIEERPSAHELYMTIGIWLNQCLFVPNSEIAKEFKNGDELRPKIQKPQVLHPDNVLYSTVYDIIDPTDQKTSDLFNIEDSTDFEIPEDL
ncbi:15443_t:CDS:2 [Cetraspora pellucida]|uniref:15443_t:CDS:1 n=1 Tax=Cetraspora pellucida TaxID=1433469 RepID=A0A9N9AE78_9GLOM|nr:15443_t:CDS:2 [Cetraspora pellucida]